MGKDLQYCIYYNLILRTRRRARDVIDLLRRNNYVPSEKYSKQTSIATIAYTEYLFFTGEPNEVDLKETKGDYKYRQSKVCPRCFTVYQIVQKYFETADNLQDNANQRLSRTTSSGNMFKVRTNSVVGGGAKQKGNHRNSNTNDPLHTSVSGVGMHGSGSPHGGGSKSSIQGMKPITVIEKMGSNGTGDQTVANRLKQLEKGQMLALAFNQAVNIARKTVSVTQKLKSAVHSRNNSDGAASATPVPLTRLPKNKLRKADNANLLAEEREEEEHINQMYKTDKLVLGLQLKKPSTFKSNLGDRIDSPGKVSSGRAGEHSLETILQAGANFTLYIRAEDDCVQEVQAYRQHTYADTLERREKNLQEMAQKIMMERRQYVSPEGQSRTGSSPSQLRSNRKAGVENCLISDSQHGNGKHDATGNRPIEGSKG